MKVEFTARFLKDVSEITTKNVLSDIESVITEVKSATSLSEIKNMKKLKGYRFYYRIKIGGFRIGIMFINQTVVFGRAADRKTIYRIFP